MESADLLLKNTSAFVFDSQTGKPRLSDVDIAIKGGKILQINSTLNIPAQKILDLKGLTVLPGVIDSQVHFREPGLTHKEDLETGTRAAVLGGVTSVFEMPNTNPSTTTKESFEEKLRLAANRAHCDYAFFVGAAHDNTENLAELEKAPHCVGVKIFLGASFGSLLVDSDEVFEQVVKNGRRRLTIHSEDEARLRERKHIAIEAAHPRVHHIWRDEESAMISTKKSIALARKYNRPIHILHVSSSEEMEFLAKQKDIASVEILPQFLTLSAPECYERLGTLAQQNPPIRDKRHMEKLWQAVLNGTVDVIGSDHAPHTLEEKAKPYPQSPSGFPGVQTLLPIMLNHVHNKKMPLERFVEMVTETPRRLFNVKNKGRIQPGYDADFTVVDLKKENTITNKWIASKCGYTPFDGMKVTGWPTHTIIRGNIVMSDDTVRLPHGGRAISFSSET
jgi:dihydroorotase